MSYSSSHPSAVPNSHTQNEMLNHASGVMIYGSSFSNIGRDQNQYHNCTVQQNFVHTPQKKDLNIRMDLPELDQFTEVKRGDIHQYSSDVFYCSWQKWPWEDKDDTEAAVYHAELNIVGPFAQKKVTVKTYRGRNAMEEWRRDFLSCSTDWRGDIPLFGYNMSSIPSLIFCGELIPVAHIRFDAGVPEALGREYIDGLHRTLHCSEDEIWMDPVKGKFCRGPAGPAFTIGLIYSYLRPPADVEFLKEGVFVRYLASIKKDHPLLSMLFTSYLSKHAKTFRSNHPQVISSVHNSIIAWQNVKWRGYKGFNEKEVTCGLTRLHLKDDQCRLRVYSWQEEYLWLSQALSVFHAHGIRLDEDLSQYTVVYPWCELKGTLERSKSKQRRQLHDPIYFFLENHFSPNRRFYFWSHDETGRNPLLWSRCKYLGLPFKLSLRVIHKRRTWPTKVYKTLHDYQIARGFDPRTTDFARSMGYQPWELVPLETRFQELDKDPDDDSYSLDILFDGNQGLSGFTPNSQFPHSLNTILIGKSLGTCRVMKPVRFSSMLVPDYARMLASADQLSNSEQVLDVD
ncbi:hypothetical protein L218DRAFT_990917 [Marasmius fiardii PR-910]|nr:hypothetical protein L218DRAFT_990917 [Marasmius fiardii PR-910]